MGEIVKKYIAYQVKEKNVQGVLFTGGLQQCKEFIKTQLRNRNKNDGYDEYWHTASLVIIKQILIEEEVEEIY